MNLKNIFTRSSFKGSDKEQRLFNGKLRPKYVEGIIDKLKDDEIFVFGSNLDGYHGGGAAYLAFKKFGAIWGQGVGLQGHSYAIPTMQGGTETIKPYVDEFIAFAQKHTELYFYVTRIGCGIAGFTDADIAPLFIDAVNIDWQSGFYGCLELHPVRLCCILNFPAKNHCP